MADKQKRYTLSEEALAELCGLIRESHSVSEGINDDSVATNSTYSSKKIDEMLDEKATKSFVTNAIAEAQLNGDANTVNGHTVETDVPTDAVFTDTVYDDSDVKNSLDLLNTTLNNMYSDDAGDIISSCTVTNATLGVDITSSIIITHTFKHIKIGKIHFVTVYGGRKITNSTTTEYRINLTIEVPGDFFVCTELYENQGGGLTLNDATSTLYTNNCKITQVYSQNNATSSYTPDSVYQLRKVFMLIEN